MTSKGSDQTARMRRLIGGFAGRTYHIVGYLMSRLSYLSSDKTHIPYSNMGEFDKSNSYTELEEIR